MASSALLLKPPVDMENLPCIFTGQEIEAERAGAGVAYKSAAKGRRGVTGSESAGSDRYVYTVRRRRQIVTDSDERLRRERVRRGRQTVESDRRVRRGTQTGDSDGGLRRETQTGDSDGRLRRERVRRERVRRESQTGETDRRGRKESEATE